MSASHTRWVAGRLGDWLAGLLLMWSGVMLAEGWEARQVVRRLRHTARHLVRGSSLSVLHQQTHKRTPPPLQVVDRPTQGHRFLSREYVQPQWVFDSANFRVLAAPGLYAPGRAPPPHLSPFVSGEEEGYVPEYGKQLAALQEAAHAARRRRAAAAAGGDVFVGEVAAAAEGGGGAVLSAEEELEAAEARYAADLAKEMKVGGGGAGGGWAEA